VKIKHNLALEISQIQDYMNGNDAALIPIVARTRYGVQYVISSLINDRYLAEDILQDTYLRAVEQIKNGNYANEGRIQLWLNRIAYNFSIDTLRKKQCLPMILLESNDSIFTKMRFAEEHADEKIDRAFREKRVTILLSMLKPELRETIILRHFVGLSFKEISALQGVNINTCLGRMRYALIYLREILEKQSVEI